ncbi:MAG TPA: hypothetical protein ENI86_04315 [Acidimicrobiales bacterium]|nr:hypothetical protein [Acidimicrobiales bacterium]
MIDMHTHCLPGPLVAELQRRETPPDIDVEPDGSATLGIHTGRIPYSTHFVDTSARLELMDRAGVHTEVLSLPGLFGVDSLAAAEALPLCRLFNDGVAAIAAAHPGRFVGLASLPLADLGQAATEYRRARTELGLAGVILPGDGFVDLATAQTLAPVFDAVAELGGLVFVHPGPLPGDGPNHPARTHADSPLHRRVTVDIQNRLSHVMVTLALTDFLEPWPEVPVQVANLGGSLPAMIERMDLVSEVRRPGEPLPSEVMKRLWVDCSTMGPRAIELAVAVYGADRVMMGTDTPVFGPRTRWEALEAAALPPSERRRIAHDNAADLLASVT